MYENWAVSLTVKSSFFIFSVELKNLTTKQRKNTSVCGFDAAFLLNVFRVFEKLWAMCNAGKKLPTIASTREQPVNALAQNMFSRVVKRLSFRCQTFKFSLSNVKFYSSTLLKGKMILINKKGRNYQKGVPLSTICRIKWKNLSRIILSQKLGED